MRGSGFVQGQSGTDLYKSRRVGKTSFLVMATFKILLRSGRAVFSVLSEYDNEVYYNMHDIASVIGLHRDECPLSICCKLRDITDTSTSRTRMIQHDDLVQFLCEKFPTSSLLFFLMGYCGVQDRISGDTDRTISQCSHRTNGIPYTEWIDIFKRDFGTYDWSRR